MLCPAILDPFDSQLYRLCGVTHQAFLCPFMCKFVCATAKLSLVMFELVKSKMKVLEVDNDRAVSMKGLEKVD